MKYNNKAGKWSRQHGAVANTSTPSGAWCIAEVTLLRLHLLCYKWSPFRRVCYEITNCYIRTIKSTRKFGLWRGKLPYNFDLLSSKWINYYILLQHQYLLSSHIVLIKYSACPAFLELLTRPHVGFIVV